MRRAFAVACAALLSLSAVVGAQSAPFLETFDGTPAQPTPLSPAGWDMLAIGFDTRQVGQAADVAHHGPNCEPPGFPYTAQNTHPLQTAADMVFQCAGHIMTSTGVTGYAAIYMTPNALMDFSQGESVLSWQMSTLRTSSRDWVDVVLTPLDEHSQIAYQNTDQHIPPDNIHVLLGGVNTFIVSQRAGGGQLYGQGTDMQLPQDTFTTWDMVFAAHGVQESAQRRDTFEIRLSRTHLSLCMPDYLTSSGGVFCWADTALRVPLDPAVWHDQATVQLNHRSYNAEKSCEDGALANGFDANTVLDQFGIVHNAYGDTHCPPNTWHWDTVTINPAARLPIIQSNPPHAVLSSAAPQSVSFAAPAPENARLAFVSFGRRDALSVSYDGGANWHQPQFQPQLGSADDAGESIFDPMPAGAQQVMVRGGNGFWGGFEASGFVVYGAADGTFVVPSPTSTSVATPTPSVFPTASASPTPTVTPTQVPTRTLVPTDTPQPTGTAMPTATTTPTPERSAAPVRCRVSVEINGTPGPYNPC